MKINIKGPIIPSNHQWIYDLFGIEATSPKKVSEQLENAGEEDLDVYVNSGGGSVFDASEIYTDLRNHPGAVNMNIVGLAASAASVISMAGYIKMSPTAQMMIHNASTISVGDHRDMDHTSSFLKNVNQTIANAYSLKSGKTYDELLNMMDDETWMTAQQAKEHGLIDEIMFDEGISAVASSNVLQNEVLPKKVINKILNEYGQNPKGVLGIEAPVNNQTSPNSKEEEEIMNLEELKNKHPDLYNQVRKEGHDEGVKTENARIKAIEDLEIPGSENLATKAKFETNETAEQLAVNILKAQKQDGKQYLKNAEKDADELNEINGDQAPENNNSEEKEIEDTASNMASFINNQRGGSK